MGALRHQLPDLVAEVRIADGGAGRTLRVSKTPAREAVGEGGREAAKERGAFLVQQRGEPVPEEDVEPIATAVAIGADFAAERIAMRVHAAGAVRETGGEALRQRPADEHRGLVEDTTRGGERGQRSLDFELGAAGRSTELTAGSAAERTAGLAAGGGGTGGHGGDSGAAGSLANAANWNGGSFRAELLGRRVFAHEVGVGGVGDSLVVAEDGGGRDWSDRGVRRLGRGLRGGGGLDEGDLGGGEAVEGVDEGVDMVGYPFSGGSSSTWKWAAAASACTL